MNALITTFDCDGEKVTVVTTRQEGESLASLAARHRARVEEAKGNCNGSEVPVGPLQTSWEADLGEMTYASPKDYAPADQAADVAALKEFFPPT